MELSDLQVDVYDEYGRRAYSCSSLECQITTRDDLMGFSVKIELTQNVMDGIIEIRPLYYGTITSITEGYEFNEYPIIIPHVHYLKTNIEPVIRSTVQNTNLFRTITNIILTGVTPLVSIQLDHLFSDFLYLSLLSGPIITWQETLLQLFSGFNIFPFDIPNFFSFLAEGYGVCVPGEIMHRREVECNLFANFGQDLFNLLATLFINIVIALLCKVLLASFYSNKKNKMKVHPRENANMGEDHKNIIQRCESPIGKKNVIGSSKERAKQMRDVEKTVSKSRIRNAIEFIDKNYGPRFFFVKMEGVQLQVLTFVGIHLFNTQSNGYRSITGIIISSLLLLFFIINGLMTCITAYRIWRHSDYQANLQKSGKPSSETDLIECINTTPKANKKQVEMVDTAEKNAVRGVIDLSQLAPAWITFQFEEMSSLATLKTLVMSIVRFIRTFLLGLVLPWFWKTAPIETLFLLYSLKANIKAERHHYWVEAVIDGLRVLYLWVKMSTVLNIWDKDFMQNSVGLAMISMLMLIIVISVLYELFAICAVIFSGCKYMFGFGMKRPNSPLERNLSPCMIESKSPTLRYTAKNKVGFSSAAKEACTPSTIHKVLAKYSHSKAQTNLNGNQTPNSLKTTAPLTPTRSCRIRLIRSNLEKAYQATANPFL